jgi:endonuclease/exonuclease/phosphatase family metal-dependent hydrolase
LEWFHNIEMLVDTDWLVIGDFNLIRKLEDRNKPRGNMREMLDFNAAINRQGLEELRLNGARFTWTNKQQSPLLERLDWFFALTTWMTSFPGSMVSSLSRDTSDHTPYLISISTESHKQKYSGLKIIGCFMRISLQ